MLSATICAEVFSDAHCVMLRQVRRRQVNFICLSFANYLGITTFFHTFSCSLQAIVQAQTRLRWGRAVTRIAVIINTNLLSSQAEGVTTLMLRKPSVDL